MGGRADCLARSVLSKREGEPTRLPCYDDEAGGVAPFGVTVEKLALSIIDTGKPHEANLGLWEVRAAGRSTREEALCKDCSLDTGRLALLSPIDKIRSWSGGRRHLHSGKSLHWRRFRGLAAPLV